MTVGRLAYSISSLFFQPGSVSAYDILGVGCKITRAQLGIWAYAVKTHLRFTSFPTIHAAVSLSLHPDFYNTDLNLPQPFHETSRTTSVDHHTIFNRDIHS